MMFWSPLLAGSAQIQAGHQGITPSPGSLGLTGNAPTQAIQITPPAGSLSVAGVAPVVTVGLAVGPGALSFTGQAPQVFTAHLITPPAGALGIAGNTPRLGGPVPLAVTPEYAKLFNRKRNRGAQIFDHYTAGGSGAAITVPAGALAFSGLPPSTPVFLIPGTGALGLTGAASALNLTIVPPAGALALAGNAPSGLNNGATPPAGALAFVGQTPTRVIGSIITPPAGALALAGAAGTASGNIVPAVGALALSGLSPTVPTPGAITPTQGALAFSGSAPSLGITIVPGAGSLGILGAQSSLNAGVFPRTGALALVGTTPTGFGIAPPAASLAFMGAAPLLSLKIVIPSGALAIAGQAPVLNPTGTPSTGGLALQGQAPRLGLNITPPTGALGLAGQAAAPVITIPIVPASATLGFAGQAPVFGYGVIPGAGSLSISGQQSFVPGGVITPNPGSLGFTGGTPLVTVSSLPPVIPPVPPPVPVLPPEPAYDLELDELFQTAFAGILSGFIDPTLVRPLWQLTPPDEPSITTDWMAVGSNVETGTDYPIITPQGPDQITNDQGSVLESELEVIEVLAVFYGPNAQKNAARLRDGIAIPQNMEPLQSAGIFYNDHGPARTIPELINQQWRRRVDVLFTFSRQVTRLYEIPNVAVSAIHLFDDTGHVDRTIPVPPPVN